MSNHSKGHFAEKLACLYLMGHGWWPVKMNFIVGRGTGAGEVDLIMERRKTLIFVEVKYRPTFEQAMAAITVHNQVRVARTSAAFLQQYPKYRSYQVRYDALLLSPKKWPKHIPNAWSVL
ncbi:MAG: YraN family protein [Alphaproteobacteria bacterium]|nr:YraN family protein [Alphaproteobacteria bacterium]